MLVQMGTIHYNLICLATGNRWTNQNVWLTTHITKESIDKIIQAELEETDIEHEWDFYSNSLMEAIEEVNIQKFNLLLSKWLKPPKSKEWGN